MKNKIVIVGASSGIGLYLAKSLVKDETQIILAARNIEKLNAEFAEEIKSGKAVAYKLDAESESDVKTFFESIGEFNHLISTIRGAGINTSFVDADTENVKKAFDGKFWTQFTIAKYAAKNINENGSITLTSGIVAKRGYKGLFWQAAINGAIESLVKSLAAELAPIRANAVSPGFIESDGDNEARLNNSLKIEPKILLKRLGTKAEIAEAYKFAMNCSYLTGSVIEADGGILCV
jgi:NAD(P)-dependent dehydrogenase (short-subunit alcohol dehydrogenase family)